jgi:CHAT domain-containing protein/tetratricopeptide (TPR) repeat protein
MWDTFERRVTDSTAAAMRLAEELVSLAPQAALERLARAMEGMDDAGLRGLWRVLKLLDYHEKKDAQAAAERGATLTALLGAVEEALAQRTEAAGTPPSPPSPEKLQAYSRLLEAYNQAMAAHSPARAAETMRALEPLADEARRLMAVEPVAYLRDDLAAYACDVLATKADCYAELGQAAEARSTYERAIQEAHTHGLGALVDGYRLKLAHLLYTQAGDWDRALGDLLPLEQSMRAGGPSLARARVSTLLAEADVNIGDLFEARQALDRAEDDLGRLGYAAPEPGHADKTLAGWIATADRTTTGPNAFREALYSVLTTYTSLVNMRAKTAAAPEEGAAATALTEALARLGQELMTHDQAIAERDQRALLRLAPEPMGDAPTPEAAMLGFGEELGVLTRRINALRARMDAREAPEPLLAEASTLVDEARRLKAGRMVGILLDMQAELLLGLGRRADAVGVWRQAYGDSIQAGQLGDGLYMLTRIANVYLEEGDHAAISDVCGEVIDQIERYRYHVSPAYLQSAFLQQKVHFYFLGVFSAYKLGDYDLMLRRAELTKAHASLRQQLQPPPEADPGALEADMRRVNQALSDAGPEAAEELRARRRVLWDRLAIQRAEARGQPAAPEFSLRAVQAALPADQAVVYYYWLGPGVLLVAALDREHIRVERQLMNDEEYAGLVQAIDYPGHLDDADAHADMINAYAGSLLPEPAQAVLRGKRCVIFSPHRVLHGFPFHALRWEGDYLITRLAVSYAPNLTSLLVRTPPNGAGAVLAVGAEHFEVPGLALPPLPGAAREVDELRALYARRGEDIVVLLEGDASLERVRQWAAEGRLASFRVLHLAVHGRDVPTDTPMEAYLCLQDGLLDGLEIAAWRLKADVVVLSACNSGKRAMAGRGMATLPGDEMFGLQAAFFSAGARRVLGALWPAEDETTRQIMTAFHRYLGDLAPEPALQAAVVDFLSCADSETRKPLYWAPFFISAVGQVAPASMKVKNLFG